jgi:hypothetical protein
VTLFLSLESALADARADVEKAGESLHDAAIKAAQLKADYDMKAEQVRRLEGALNALHGATTAPVVPAAVPVQRPPKVAELTGPTCIGCGEVGKIVRINSAISTCSACNAQYVG